MVMDADALMRLEEKLQPILQQELVCILTRLNQQDKIEHFLQLIDAEDLLHTPKTVFQNSKRGNIVVIGESDITQNIMEGIMKKLGLRKDRLECYLGYEKAKKFSYQMLRYQYKYALVLVGSMGHKANGIGDHTSAISMMEQEEGYPPVKRLGAHNLHITKTNFREALQEALQQNIILAE